MVLLIRFILCVHAELRLLHCHFHSTQRSELFDNFEKANLDFKNLSDKDQVSFMLYGSKTNTSENFNQNKTSVFIFGLIF